VCGFLYSLLCEFILLEGYCSDVTELNITFLQMLKLSSTPFILTLLNKRGLTGEDAGVRLLEELALHAARYKVFVRPLIGYIGAYTYAFAFSLVCSPFYLAGSKETRKEATCDYTNHSCFPFRSPRQFA